MRVVQSWGRGEGYAINPEEESAQFVQGLPGCSEVFTFTDEKLGESFKKRCDLIWWMILKEHFAGWILKGQELIQGDK